MNVRRIINFILIYFVIINFLIFVCSYIIILIIINNDIISNYQKNNYTLFDICMHNIIWLYINLTLFRIIYNMYYDCDVSYNYEYDILLINNIEN